MAYFLDHPILNSAYEYPGCHWQFDADRQPTNNVVGRVAVKVINHLGDEVMKGFEWSEEGYETRGALGKPAGE